MKHLVRATNRETGAVKFAEIEAETPEKAVRRVDRSKYDVTIVEVAAIHSGDESDAEADPQLATNPDQASPSDAKEKRGYKGLPAWVATEETMKSAGITIVAFFAILALAIGGLVLGELGRRGQITIGHILAFGIGFAVVALALIIWKLSTIATTLQANSRDEK